MKKLWLAALGLALTFSSAFATAIVPPPVAPPNGAGPGTVHIDALNNTTQAAVTFNDGAGHSGVLNAFLTQFDVTYHNGNGTSATFDTFCIDLFHTASLGQTYAVILRNALDPFFANGNRMRFVLDHFGTSDLTGHPDQATAVQIALWDLSLNNHNPTSFGPDSGSAYSSGDPSVFSVNFGANPQAASIASLVDQYLVASEGASTSGGWIDASGAGDSPNRGQSLLIPGQLRILPNGTDLGVAVPGPPSFALLIAGLVVLCGTRGMLPGRRRAENRVGSRKAVEPEAVA